MKKVFIGLAAAASIWAAPYTVGQSLPPLDLHDQFGQHQVLRAMPHTLIMAFERETAATVNEYLSTQGKGYLFKNNAAFIADISQMPKFVAEAFALPKMQKYPYSVLLIEDEELGLKFPAEEEKITVMTFNGNVLSAIRYISTASELKQTIEP